MLLDALYLSGKHINLCDPVDLVSEKLHPDAHLSVELAGNISSTSPRDPESASVKVHFVSVILDINKLFDHIISVFPHSRTQGDHHIIEILEEHPVRKYRIHDEIT